MVERFERYIFIAELPAYVYRVILMFKNQCC